MELTQNTILITGGATGIGFALARQLSERGNQVIICGRSEQALARARAAVPALATQVCDIANARSRQLLVAWLHANHPALNILVNNAGVQYRRSVLEEGAFDTVDEEVAINFTAPVRLIGELLPMLRRQPNAVIVNISSGLAFVPIAAVPVYCATKAALHSFSLSLRHQLKASGIRVVEIAPPTVDTNLGGARRNARATGVPMMSPEDLVSQAISQLAEGKDEVLVGTSANSRRQGEALFDRINSH